MEMDRSTILTVWSAPTTFEKIVGNLWRAKLDSEISHNISSEFDAFTRHCMTTTSEDTGITYHYSPNGTVYLLADVDETMCAYSLERTIPSEYDVPNIAVSGFFRLYFQKLSAEFYIIELHPILCL
ncbi:hypothetical protein OESDEN_01297 [Oesophagostomum dentatum]|uniref:Uncharacterized protein n=1 Tax=Oesophagostomum dentatum TaxID=61180 RepID=A0A0B1TMG8_OESDE|nr:hypothetical protein OESDEN_01297 [Oesophagostomum dentatum]